MGPIAIKGANKLPVRDLKAIAHFFRIIKNYEKTLRIEGFIPRMNPWDFPLKPHN